MVDLAPITYAFFYFTALSVARFLARAADRRWQLRVQAAKFLLFTEKFLVDLLDLSLGEVTTDNQIVRATMLYIDMFADHPKRG